MVAKEVRTTLLAAARAAVVMVMVLVVHSRQQVVVVVLTRLPEGEDSATVPVEAHSKATAGSQVEAKGFRGPADSRLEGPCQGRWSTW